MSFQPRELTTEEYKSLIKVLQMSIDGTGTIKEKNYPAGQRAKDKEQIKIIKTKIKKLENEQTNISRKVGQ